MLTTPHEVLTKEGILADSERYKQKMVAVALTIKRDLSRTFLANFRKIGLGPVPATRRLD